ncbi:NrtA/SsuA/CpmA family ABC transporter substrate-binding protein [Streptacidiphilus jiangxiensis]|uniref:Sulfonate transport system substrate-binding protein n=1 Tax=Streptacidiphilus jiangxiensis TaxID=235985 RepID=A0A1H7TCN9_STRJI|nr:NrtA/SsuA/CpmA family ABC transporter substrate-binding protein [Streptacidiphilus jiangxiensis]SEL82285.1 sulfonate transport system substrate-binding protein [Streptacidiphilus jiangxiensis]
MKTRPVLLSATALLAGLGLAACSSGATVTSSGQPGADATNITVRIPDQGNSGILALGRKDGSLARALAKVHAKVVWTGTAGAFAPAAQELDANALDVAEGSITSATAALAQSPGFKLFAAVAPDRLGEGILVKNNSGITSVKDLVGKKVAVWHGGTSEYLLLKALQQNGVPVGSVTRVYLQPNQIGPVFNSGQVDAWSTWASFSVPQIADHDSHFLVTGDQVGSLNYAVWAVRTGFADQHPAVVKALYAYLHDAGLKQQQNPAAYLNVNTTSGPEAVSAAQQAVELPIDKALGTAQPIDATALNDFHTVAQFFADQKITKGFFDVKPSVIDVTSLPASAG